jgi:hypothetical protein
MEPVCAKIQGLGKKYITLTVPILIQNLIDLGHLLSFSHTTGLALIHVLKDAIKGIKGGCRATLLFNWAANGMLPAGSFGGLTNTPGSYRLIRQVLRSLRAVTTGGLLRTMSPGRYQLTPIMRGASEK